jgi:hypothetical protein
MTGVAAAPAFDGLAAWRGERGPLMARVLQAPGFGRAVRTLAVNMLALTDADPTLDLVFKDAGRYVVADWAMHLASAGALTLPGLKALGVRSGIVSAGRVRAVMQVLEHLGYLIETEPSAGRRPAHFRASESFLTAWRAHHRGALEAAAIIEPAAEAMVEAVDDPQLYAAFSRIHGEILVMATEGDPSYLQAPFFAILYQSLAGMHLIWSLLATMEDDVFPPRAPLRFSIPAAAQRFSVSPAHFRRVLDAAEQADLIRRDRSGVILTEQTGALLSYIYAAQFVMMLGAASLALAGE